MHTCAGTYLCYFFFDAIENKLGIKATREKWKLYVLLVVDNLLQPFNYCLEVEESYIQSILS